MKHRAFLTLASTLLVSACGSSGPDEMAAQTPGAIPPTPFVYNYRCESGETIAATYPSTNSAEVRYKGDDYNMQIAVSASGARYVGDGLEWWTKGSAPGADGTLFHHQDDGTSGEIIEHCTRL